MIVTKYYAIRNDITHEYISPNGMTSDIKDASHIAEAAARVVIRNLNGGLVETNGIWRAEWVDSEIYDDSGAYDRLADFVKNGGAQ